MNIWQEILAPFQGIIDSQGEALFPTKERNASATFHPLVDKGLLLLTGPQTNKFLQGQVTCNMDDMTSDHWQPGAICDPKGRMITSFNLYPLPEEQILLEMDEPLVEETINAIKKYSAFFKTQLSNATTQYHITGLQGEGASTALVEQLGFPLNQNDTFTQHNELAVIQVSPNRYKIISPVNQTAGLWQTLSQAAVPTGINDWRLADIQQGIGEVTGYSRGLFVPQMLNLQARNGISFRKGCYTGQEIVARMKYLGKLKRRMYRLGISGKSLPLPGTPCFAEGTNSAQGNVVSAARASASEHQTEALVVMTKQLAQSARVIFDKDPEQTFEILSLPYSLDDN